MTTVTLSIKNPTGLHTRPGTRFVKQARQFVSNIEIEKSNKSADAKNLIRVMKIGISQGDTVILRADGQDETAAIEHLAAFIENLEE
jgi:phosphocarrier protein HPr